MEQKENPESQKLNMEADELYDNFIAEVRSFDRS